MRLYSNGSIFTPTGIFTITTNLNHIRLGFTISGGTSLHAATLRVVGSDLILEAEL